MNSKEFSEKSPGKVVNTDREYCAFIPDPLPPEIVWSSELVNLLTEAERALSQLLEVGKTFPNPHIMAKPFIRREAVLSSRIEGTHTTLEELYVLEAQQLPLFETNANAKEVQNYVKALEFGLNRLDVLPISLRLIRKLHEYLMKDVRGEFWHPGEFRRSQNWIGAAGATLQTVTYVPPPVEEMHSCLYHFEKFIHSASELPDLIRLAMIHYQFEAIHPFLDGNGRVGRLLIPILLVNWKLLAQPLLYLSAYFESKRSEYYQRLLAVSQLGEWENWLKFFLKGVRDQAKEAKIGVDRIITLRRRYENLFRNERASARLMQVIDYLIGQPVTTIRQVEAGINASTYQVAQRYVNRLVQLGVLREVTGMSRNRIYRADEILRVILA